jgi:hypothetical protein
MRHQNNIYGSIVQNRIDKGFLFLSEIAFPSKKKIGLIFTNRIFCTDLDHRFPIVFGCRGTVCSENFDPLIITITASAIVKNSHGAILKLMSQLPYRYRRFSDSGLP